MRLRPDDLRREIQQRRILPLLGIFLASGFLVLEGVDQLIGHDLIPSVTYSIAIVFYVFGIPGTIIIAWFHGQKGPQRPRPIELWMHGFMLVGALGISYGLLGDHTSPGDLETLPLVESLVPDLKSVRGFCLMADAADLPKHTSLPELLCY